MILIIWEFCTIYFDHTNPSPISSQIQPLHTHPNLSLLLKTKPKQATKSPSTLWCVTTPGEPWVYLGPHPERKWLLPTSGRLRIANGSSARCGVLCLSTLILNTREKESPSKEIKNMGRASLCLYNWYTWICIKGIPRSLNEIPGWLLTGIWQN